MKNVDVPSFRIKGETIQEVDNVKYLGHFISNTLRDDKDILRQRRPLYCRGNTLLRKYYVFKYYKDEAIRRIELFVFYSAND